MHLNKQLKETTIRNKVFKLIDKENANESLQQFRLTASNLKWKSENFCSLDEEEKEIDSFKSSDLCSSKSSKSEKMNEVLI